MARTELPRPHELLIATILSAQATDVGVNKATPALFKAFPTPADYARVTPQDIEPFINSIGLFRNKAKAVHAAMARVCDEYDGVVPHTMTDLLTLRGVARKTANVVLGNAFDLNMGVVVCARCIQPIRLMKVRRRSQSSDLMAISTSKWTLLSHLLIFHGRRVCKAKGALCADDPICRTYHVDD